MPVLTCLVLFDICFTNYNMDGTFQCTVSINIFNFKHCKENDNILTLLRDSYALYCMIS